QSQLDEQFTERTRFELGREAVHRWDLRTVTVRSESTNPGKKTPERAVERLGQRSWASFRPEKCLINVAFLCVSTILPESRWRSVPKSLTKRAGLASGASFQLLRIPHMSAESALTRSDRELQFGQLGIVSLKLGPSHFLGLAKCVRP